jgi:hypothetical protein
MCIILLVCILHVLLVGVTHEISFLSYAYVSSTLALDLALAPVGSTQPPLPFWVLKIRTYHMQ